MHPDAKKLFAMDENLRREAEEMLARSGIGPILTEAGYKAVGSYVMRTMTWRDLDFEREEEPDWEKHWEVGTKLAKTGWFWRLNCVNSYRERRHERGLYWGLRIADPSKPDPADDPSAIVWKMDLWTFRPEDVREMNELRATFTSLMNEEKRAEILALKKALWHAPEYRKTLLSIHIYEAVLQEGVRGVEAFMEWWRGKYQQDE